MKAENTKERKREEKERKGKDPVWLIFFVFLESTSVAPCCMHSVKTSPIVGCAVRNEELSKQKASICEKKIGILGRVLEIG